MSVNESGIECEICGSYNCDYVCVECYNKETHDLMVKNKELDASQSRLFDTISDLKKKLFSIEAEARQQAFRDAISKLQILLDKSDGQYDEINFREYKEYDMPKVELYHKMKTKIIKNLIAELRNELPKE